MFFWSIVAGCIFKQGDILNYEEKGEGVTKFSLWMIKNFLIKFWYFYEHFSNHIFDTAKFES